MKYKKHLPLILVPVFLLLSITSILFTWDLVKAGFYYRSDREKSARSMVAALQHKSSAYNALAKFNETALNNLLVKNTIAHQNLSYLGDLDLAPKNIETLHTKFKDNFFLAVLNGNIHDQNGSWENLDAVAMEIISDQLSNTRTIPILTKINHALSYCFKENLADYCAWKNNKELRDFVLKDLPARKSPNTPDQPFGTAGPSGPNGKGETGNQCGGARAITPAAPQYKQSIDNLRRYLKEKFKPNGVRVANLLSDPAFDKKEDLMDLWRFSNMAGHTPFSRGSFTMGADTRCGNPCLRIMGFFVEHKEGKSKPRGGAYYRTQISTRRGWYLFSFDYLTKTGREGASFYMGPGIREQRLRHSGGKWKKALFIFHIEEPEKVTAYLMPLLRMWGTGTLLLDNALLSEVKIPQTVGGNAKQEYMLETFL